MADIPGELIGEMQDKLKAGDTSWFETALRNGRLDWLKNHLSPSEWLEFPKRLASKDLGWLRGLLGGPKFGGSASGLSGAAGAAAGGLAGGVAGGLSGLKGAGEAAAGAAGDLTGRLSGAAGDVAGGLTGGLKGAADAAGGVTGRLGDAASGVTGGLADTARGGFGKIVGGAAATGAGGLGLVALAGKLRDMLAGKFDWDWLGKAHKAGDLDALKPHMAGNDWNDVPKRIAAKDESWFRRVLGGLDLPGIGKLGAGAAAAAAVTGAVGSKVTGAKAAGAKAVGGKLAVDAADGKRKKAGWWKWLLPLVLLGLLIWALSKCGGDDDTTAPTTTAVATTVAGATSTAVATTAAPTTAAATTSTAVATTAAATTTAAPTTTAAATTTTAAPAATATTAAAAPALPADLLAAAKANGKFNTLLGLLDKAGLSDAIKTGPNTLFGPTDDAFAAVPKATMDYLAANPAVLKSVLQYHLAAGSLKAADLKAGPLASLLTGQNLTIGIAGGKVTINSANVSAADIAAMTGVLHAIDKVLIPADVAAKVAAAGGTTAASIPAVL